MFIELTKEWQGRKPGERLDLADADGKVLIAQNEARAVENDSISAAIDSAMKKAEENFSRAIDAKLKEFAQAAGQVAQERGAGHLRAGRRRRSQEELRRLLPGRRPQGHALPRKALRQPASTPGTPRRPWARRAASPAATPCRPISIASSCAIIEENTFIRPRAFVQPMASATPAVPVPRHHHRPESAGVSPFFGGVQMNWTAEAQTRTETEPQFKMMELKAWELSGYSRQLQRAAAGRGVRPGEVPLRSSSAGPSPGTRNTPSCRATASASRRAC